MQRRYNGEYVIRICQTISDQCHLCYILLTKQKPLGSNSEGKNGKQKSEPMKITEQSFLSFQPTYQLLQPSP